MPAQKEKEVERKLENDPQRIAQSKKRRSRYKTPEFREAITNAFHKAKLHALDDPEAREEEVIPSKAAQ